MNKIYEKHGFATNGISPIYSRWYAMIERCHKKGSSSYKYYGARGIKVCDEWRKSVRNFVKDMGIPLKGMTLERIDNDGDYCKENCRWATRKEQRQNQRLNKNTTFITFEGKTLSLKEWAKEKGIAYGTLYNRIYVWKIKPEKALIKKFGRSKIK